MALNGNNIFISLDENAAPFAMTRSNEIQTECGIIEVSGPDTGDWDDCLSGRKKWSFTVNYLYGDADSIANLLMSGNTYNISIYSRLPNVQLRLSGTAICQAVKVSATIGNLVQGSFSFKGKGPLNPVLVTSVSLTPVTLNLTAGQGYNHPITVTVLPTNATNKKVTWESSDESVVTVDSNGNVFAMAAGSCYVTATSSDGSNKSASCAINVTSQ